MFNVVITWARTVESFPPDAPIATFSPFENKLFETIVWWISSSKTMKKQSLQIGWPVLGLLIFAGFSLQS